MRIAVFFTACGMLVASPATGNDAQTTREIRFNRDIRPLLAENCLACHGPDSSSREADLRLDRREGAVAGEVIVPGDAGASELIARITSEDPDTVMPPPGSDKRLSDSDKRLLARWVNAGAEYEPHWSFIPPRKAALPNPPGVERWARNPIDHFVLARLRAAGLRPNGPDEPYRLARRAALDLTGLPPNQKLLDEYVAGRANNHAEYARYIDALLSSASGGEHRARYWLDAARYGDTHGMHVDNYREMWPYRDWVIRAFTANMPFDRFVVEQIAGDLLPHATLDQRIATGFNRCNITTSEGGAISEEVNVRYMVDRVETTATVFLGLTAGCAVCHDHKYDPITQREFYQLGAFFNNTTQPAMDGNQRDTPPVVSLPRAEFADEWRELSEQRRILRTELRRWTSNPRKWWPNRDRRPAHPVSPDGLLLWVPLTEGEGESTELPREAEWATDHPAGRRGIRFGEGSQLDVDLPRLRTDEPLTVSFWFRTPDRVMVTTLFDQTIQVTAPAATDGDSPKKESTTVGWRITNGVRSELTFELFDANGDRVSALLPDNEALSPRTWQHVCVRYSGGQSKSSITILVNGRAVAIRHGSEGFVAATELAKAPLRIGSQLPTAGLSDIRIYRRWINDREVQLLAGDHLLLNSLKQDLTWENLASADRALAGQFFEEVIDQEYRRRAAELAETQRRRDFIYARSTTTLVMRERGSEPRAWVLQRGEYDQRREEVAPGVPAVLPALPDAMPRNRLALARWLVDPDHPLTARVMVNRLWQSVFGVGLVKTSEDFGVMGDRPSHPGLLDWLAVEFVESSWDVNHLLKLMLTSAAYRQSARITPEKFAADPLNRLFARGPRTRLDAEVLRDQALAVSGLLRDDVGGPSVRPYQPAGLWKVVAITGSNTAEFKQDTGAALYRRSLYTFWKRTSPPPSLAAFNAPTREQCTVRRERTNTPLQALVLMNDPQYVEAARHLAENAMRRHNVDRSLVCWLLETALRRPPREADVMELTAAAAEFRVAFRQHPTVAGQLVRTGESVPDASLDISELATWTLVANTIMNRDDFVCK